MRDPRRDACSPLPPNQPRLGWSQVERGHIGGLLCLLVCFAVSTFAHAAKVVIFKTKSIAPYEAAAEGFKNTCKAESTTFDMGGSDQQGLALVENIRGLNPAAVLAIGSKAAKIAKEKLPEVPVIFCMVLNPDRRGVLGPNTTGILLQVPYSRQFQMLKTIMPSLKVVGVLYDPAKTVDNVTQAIQEAQEAGVRLLPKEVKSKEEVPGALRALLKVPVGDAAHVDMLWLTMDSTVLNKQTFKYIVGKTMETSVPIMAYQASFVKAGAFYALAPSYDGIGRQAGKLANQLIDGASVTDLPVLSPDSDTLAINLKVANAFGIPVPPAVVDLADVIVKAD